MRCDRQCRVRAFRVHRALAGAPLRARAAPQGTGASEVTVTGGAAEMCLTEYALHCVPGVLCTGLLYSEWRKLDRSPCENSFVRKKHSPHPQH